MPRRKTLPEPVVMPKQQLAPVVVPEPVPGIAAGRRKKAAVVMPPPIVAPAVRRRVRKVAEVVPEAPKAGKKNAWIEHVKRVAKEKGLKMKDAMKAAKKTYVRA